MIKIKYTQPNELENKENIILHNIITADKFKKSECLELSVMGWLKADKTRNYQDLEKHFRTLGLNSYVIAKIVTGIPPYVSIVLPYRNKKNLSYIASLFCGTKEDFMEELKKFHKSYDENFNCLEKAGVLTQKDSKVEQNILNSISDPKESENVRKIIDAEVKYEMKHYGAIESLRIIKDDLVRRYGCDPKISICGELLDSHVYAFTYDGEISSPIGWTEYEGEYILIDFRKIKNNDNNKKV